MIHIKTVTPKGIYLEREVASVHMKTVEGEMTLLPHHTPVFAALVPCALQLGKADEYYALSGGFLKFQDDACLILTDAIEGKDVNTNMKRASLALARAINRISVYEK